MSRYWIDSKNRPLAVVKRGRTVGSWSCGIVAVDGRDDTRWEVWLFVETECAVTH
jgi:hypothetical protein